MRVTLIHNPGAGRQGKDDAAKLVKLLESFDHDVRYYSSKEDDWKRGLKKPADLMAVAGGDGTVGKVTRRMAGRGVPIGVLPSGTANNLARTLGILGRPFEELVRAWEEDPRRLKLDLGIAAGPWGERYFVEGVGAGVFANVLANPAGSKAKKGGAPVENALRRLQDVAMHSEPLELKASLDGEDISGEYLMLEALNLAYIGPNLHLAHDSHPGDGEFDLVLITEAERDRLLYYLEHWQDNRERLALLPTKRGRRLQLEWTGFPLHIDDKLKPTPNSRPKEIAGLMEARMDGEAVEFLVPAHAAAAGTRPARR